MDRAYTKNQSLLKSSSFHPASDLMETIIPSSPPGPAPCGPLDELTFMKRRISQLEDFSVKAAKSIKALSEQIESIYEELGAESDEEEGSGEDSDFIDDDVIDLTKSHDTGKKSKKGWTPF